MAVGNGEEFGTCSLSESSAEMRESLEEKEELNESKQDKNQHFDTQPRWSSMGVWLIEKFVKNSVSESLTEKSEL